MRVNGPACVTRKTVAALSAGWHGQRLSAAFRITYYLRRRYANGGAPSGPAASGQARCAFVPGVLIRSNLYARRPNLADGLDGLATGAAILLPAPGCSGPAFLVG